MSVTATFRFVFTDDDGEPTEPTLDGRNLAEPITITGRTAVDVNDEIELAIQALQSDVKEYQTENEGYGFRGLIHTDTELLSLVGATAQEVGF